MTTWTNETHDRLPKEGPWADEPDKIQWLDWSTELDCLMVRNHLGSWCGYVGVPPGHRWHGVRYQDIDVEVHGGLTFSDRCQEGAPEEMAVCHVPLDGRPADVWWLGFDTGHFSDYQPIVAEFERTHFADNPTLSAMLQRMGESQTYRDQHWVHLEVESLAMQVWEAA
jgi:hypothetical protein